MKVAWVAVWILAGAAARGQFTDGSARSGAFQYLATVREAGGAEALAGLPPGAVTALAESFGALDRASVPPAVFLEHVRLANEVRGRYYGQMPEDAFRRYLLPLRIRYELTSRAGWRPALKAELEGTGGAAATAAEAAERVFAWIGGRVKLLDGEETYPLGLRGDLDPLTTWRGGFGTEVDASILGVAALRSVGVAARLVYAPVLRGEQGGKMWLEFRDAKDWKPWVPSYALAVRGAGKAAEVSDHGARLRARFAGKWVYVVAGPDEPINVTRAYAPVGRVWMCPVPLETEPFEACVMVPCGGRLQPTMGRDLYHPEPDGSALGLGAGPFVIAAGNRSSFGGLVEGQVGAGSDGWFAFDFGKGKARYQEARNRPAFFPWEPEPPPEDEAW